MYLKTSATKGNCPWEFIISMLLRQHLKTFFVGTYLRQIVAEKC